MKYDFAILMSSAHICWRKFSPFGFLFSRPNGPSVCFIVSGSVLLVPTLQLMSCPNSSAVSAAAEEVLYVVSEFVVFYGVDWVVDGAECDLGVSF